MSELNNNNNTKEYNTLLNIGMKIYEEDNRYQKYVNECNEKGITPKSFADFSKSKKTKE